MERSKLHEPVGVLDFLLSEIIEELQLNRTQIERMGSAYGALGAWLEHPESPLARYRPVLVYPQGSARIGTTVRPLLRTEFDIDFVLQVDWFPGDPMELYALLLGRLRDHGTYAKMIEPKKRCVRICYENGFHADVLSARAVHGGLLPGNIEVPDRDEPRIWRPSNPRGFARWFEEQSRTAAQLRSIRMAEPLPADWDAAAKTVLQRIVQLAKRQRDVVFGMAENAPRSIVLTTLQATVYEGQLSVYEALVDALEGIIAMIRRSWPHRIVVLNPMNSGEDFSEGWADSERYRAAVKWIIGFSEQLKALRDIRGLDALTAALASLFGEEVSKEAMHRYQKALAAARSSGEVRALGTAILTGTGRGRPIPPNRNFGA